MAAVLNFGFRVLLCFVFVAFQLSCHRGSSEPVGDKQALLAFLSKTPHNNCLRWNASAPACSWVGVECDANRSFVFALRLSAVGLMGDIPADTLGRLSQLRVLSLRSNRLTGSLPQDFSNLVHLRSLYIQDNRFSGEFPPSLSESTRLVRLDLSSNNFTGAIPFTVNNFTNLTRLYLQNNGFTGKLPAINLPELSDLDVSNNRLDGEIPSTLSKFSASSFAGKIDLCGGPLPPCNQNSSSPTPSLHAKNTPPHKNSRKLSTAAIVGIVIGSVIAFLLLLQIMELEMTQMPLHFTAIKRKT